MPHLLRVSRKHERFPDDAFPFSVPAVRALTSLDLATPITCFVGENGSGKSTLLEGIAAAAELSSLDQTFVRSDATMSEAARLGDALRLAWSPRSRKGFFLRAEDFFDQMRSQARAWARYLREKEERETGAKIERITEDGRHIDEVLAQAHMRRFDVRSHGESFIETFKSEIRSGGLYLLDEPEAPLSPKRQIELPPNPVGRRRPRSAAHHRNPLAYPVVRRWRADLRLRQIAPRRDRIRGARSRSRHARFLERAHERQVLASRAWRKSPMR